MTLTKTKANTTTSQVETLAQLYLEDNPAKMSDETITQDCQESSMYSNCSQSSLSVSAFTYVWQFLVNSATVEKPKNNSITVQKTEVETSPFDSRATTLKTRELIARWNMVDGRLICHWNIVEH